MTISLQNGEQPFFSHRAGLIYWAIRPPSVLTGFGFPPSTLAVEFFEVKLGTAHGLWDATAPQLRTHRRIYRRGFTEFISGVIRGNFRARLPRPFGVTVVLLKSWGFTRGFSETPVWPYSRWWFYLSEHPPPDTTHSSETPRSADTRVYWAGQYRPETHRYRRKG